MIDPKDYISETAKYRSLTTQYCVGAGLDIASQGDPVVPWAWQLDLPPERFAKYNGDGTLAPRGPIQLRGDAASLPVDSGSLDFVYSSHLLEDYETPWTGMLKEWVRVLKPGGRLVILIPEKSLWDAAIAGGQPPNPAHKHEGQVGELSSYATLIGVRVLEDRMTNLFAGDYTILFVAEKL